MLFRSHLDQVIVHDHLVEMLGGKVAQMVRIRLPKDLPCIPEISANKYALNIRFTAQEGSQRPRTVETDVEFELTFCNL